MSSEKHTTCLVCSSTKLKSLKGYEKHQMVKCQDCSFVFMERIPTLKELTDHYSSYSYGSDEYESPITIQRFNEILDEFEPYRKTNKLIDVGCGRGRFLVEAKKRGWEVYGTEFSDKAVQLCTEKGITMKQGVLNPNDFELGTFDVAVSFEVLEHINNPQSEMANIASLVRQGGLFYCTTPNFDSAMRYYLGPDYNVITYPEHLSYYTKKTLVKMVENQGFKKKKFLSTGISITRIKTSKNTKKEFAIEQDNSDEKLRRDIENKWYMGVAKNLANGLFTATNSGLTLKGYFVKK